MKWAMLADTFCSIQNTCQKSGTVYFRNILCVCDVTSGSNFAINYNYRRSLVPLILLQGAMYPSLHFFF